MTTALAVAVTNVANVVRRSAIHDRVAIQTRCIVAVAHIALVVYGCAAQFTKTIIGWCDIAVHRQIRCRTLIVAVGTALRRTIDL